jgi:hypothetical protein
MLPSLFLVGVGRSRRFWIPLPVFLLWPFWLLGWVVWTVFKIANFPWEKPLRTALVIGFHLSGVRVDIDSADGDHIHLWMV